MQATSTQSRLFIIGYTRAYRMELCEAFRDQGYRVTGYADMRLAEYATKEQTHPDLVLTDWIDRESESTMAFVQRYGGLIPVLVHSTHTRLIDVVRSLKAGAADYICQPCYFPEILARLERAQVHSSNTRRIEAGRVSLDVGSGVAHIDGCTVRMTEREARILSALLRCPNQSVSRDALMRIAGIRKAQPTIIESYIKQLRKSHALLRRCIRTRYGQGYVYCPEPGA
jgi:two-component system response regulator QseB